MTPGRGRARAGRVAIFSLTAVVLAAVAHRAGGGSLSPGTALAALPVVMLVMNPLAGRRRGVASLLPAMGALQAALHYTFMTAATAARCHVLAPGSHHALNGPPNSAAMMSCAPEMSHGAVVSSAGPFSVMTLAHALAAVLVVIVLCRGEAAVWALAAALGFRAPPAGWTSPLALAVPTPQPVSQPRTRLPQFLRAHLVSRRGPPRPAFAR